MCSRLRCTPAADAAAAAASRALLTSLPARDRLAAAQDEGNREVTRRELTLLCLFDCLFSCTRNLLAPEVWADRGM